MSKHEDDLLPFYVLLNYFQVIGGSMAAFTVIQTDAGTNPVASGATDTLTLTSTELTITGDQTTDTVTWAVKNSAILAKVLTGYVSGAGTVLSTDTLLEAFQKINGNVALKAPLASPMFTGTITTPVTASRVAVIGASNELAANASLTAGFGVVASGTGGLSTPAIYDAGNSGTSKTIDFTANGPVQKVAMTGNCTFAITLGSGQPGVLVITQGASAYTAAFTSVKFPGGFAPVITTTNGAVEKVAFLNDGTQITAEFGQAYA